MAYNKLEAIQFPKADMKQIFEDRLGVKFKKIGNDWRANCPFCSAKFALIVPGGDNTRWHCHACSERGHPNDFTDFKKKLGSPVDSSPINSAAFIDMQKSGDNPELDWRNCSGAAQYTGLSSFWAVQREFGLLTEHAVEISKKLLRSDDYYWKQNGGINKEKVKSKSSFLVAPICDPIDGKIIGTQRLSVTDRSFKLVYGSIGGVFIARGNETCNDVIFVESVANAIALNSIGFHAVCVFSSNNVKVINTTILKFERDSVRAHVKLKYYLWFDAHSEDNHVASHIENALRQNKLLRCVRFTNDEPGYDVNDLLRDHNGEFPKIVRTMLDEANNEKLRENGIESISIPQFPLQVFPPWLQDFISQTANNASVPPDYPAVATLPIVATALGKNTTCEIHADWSEAARLYVALVGPSGSGKSPAIKKLMDSSVNLVEERYANENKAREQRYEDACEQYEVEKNAYRTKRKKNLPATPPTRPEPEKYSRAYTTDSTVESLNTILADNSSCLLVQDEISALINGLNQYKGSKGSDREFYLSAHAGSSALVDRKTKTTYVRDPHLCILGATTPSKLSLLVSDERGNDGLTARFLLVFPDVKASRFSEEIVAAELKQRWCKLVLDLYQVRDKKRIYALDSKSLEIYAQYYNMLSDLIDSETNEIMQSWLSKARGQMARLALILAVMHDSAVSMQIVSYAYELIKYFEAHARKCFAIANRAKRTESGDKVQRKADVIDKIITYAKRKHVTVVSVRTICRSGICAGLRASEIRKCFAAMLENGLAKTTVVNDSIDLIY